MAKILLRRVAGFNRDQLLTSQVSGLRGRNSPFGRTRGDLVTTRAGFLVSHLLMPYPNVTKQKSRLVHHLSTTVEGVDGEVLLFPIRVRFSAKRAPEHQSPTKTKVATLNRYKIVVEV